MNTDFFFFFLVWKVSCSNEFLCGVNAAIPHCDCIGFDDINALNLWRHLRLAPRWYSQLTLFSDIYIFMIRC